MDVIAELKRIRDHLDYDLDRIDATADEFVGILTAMMDMALLRDEEEDRKLSDLFDEFGEARCKIAGGHDWQYDQCSLWYHQFCFRCMARRYPEIPGSCRDAREYLRNLNVETEEQYRALAPATRGE